MAGSYPGEGKVRVAAIDEIPDSHGVLVVVGGKRLALFRYQGEFFALDEGCPHRGGPLHEGAIEDGVLVCPWHLWQFDLKTGVSPVNPLSQVHTYRIWREGSDLFVEL